MPLDLCFVTLRSAALTVSKVPQAAFVACWAGGRTLHLANEFGAGLMVTIDVLRVYFWLRGKEVSSIEDLLSNPFCGRSSHTSPTTFARAKTNGP